MSPLNIEVRAEIDDLERRKATLGDLSAINADYARAEAQHAALADVSALASLIEAARGQLVGLRQARETEAAAVSALENRRTEFTAAITSMNADIETLIARQKELSINIVKDRPVQK